ncbi:MAG: ABC-F family ATP-binding cassette domain-containing protein [Solirubrobacteraceae bacterium]
MAVVIASDLAKDIAGAPLLRGVSFALERRDRMTIAGRNGAGKTTLLRMLAGESSIDGGELAFGKGVRVALHDQRPPRERGLSLRDYVLSGCAELVALEEELRRLETAMADGDAGERTLGRYADAQAALEHAGGYTWREQATAVVHGLGFDDADLDRPLQTFSGGELTRGSLARVLASRPDLLLLDEPTNHLDIASLEWLEATLVGLDAAIVLVAHDRWFLEAVGTSVLELEAGRGRFFAGPWHAWRKEKAARELALGRAIERQEAEIARLERFVDRFRAGTRARQAQSRVKRLDKIERVARDPKDGRSLAFAFKPPERSGRVVFELQGGAVDAGDKVLLRDAELWLERGEHVVLVGANGTGKTTLIDTITGRRPLQAGKLKTGHNVTVGYLSQHAEELGDRGTVLEAAQKLTGLTPNKARALLGQFLFSGEEAEKPVAGLSGGERRRLSLAALVHSGANVLVLDEPTNHLDVESREALEDALLGFPGAVLLVSHDRALLDAVGARAVALEDGTLHSYVGGWTEAVRGRPVEKAAPPLAGPAPAAKPAAARANGRPGSEGNGSGPRRPAPSKNARRKQAELEAEIEAAEAALAALEDELAGPDAWATPERTAESSARHADAQRAVEELYARYERLTG